MGTGRCGVVVVVVLVEVVLLLEGNSKPQVLELILPEHPHISQGTVYRDLGAMADVGMLRRVSIPGEADRYDAVLTPHYHFFCRSCKAVLNFSSPKLAAYFEDAAAQTTLGKIESHNYIVIGVCGSCLHRCDESSHLFSVL